jgi:hypothetical protein
MKPITRVARAVALALLLFPPLAAQDSVVYSGIDLWETPGDYTTYANFIEDPIPAGFFCRESTAFRGKIYFQGVPVATRPARAYGSTDTIVQRLDDAVFDAEGIALTRVQVAALEFASLDPLGTECGSFDVRTELSGEQPITEMKIVRTHDHGGAFIAPIWVNVKMTFTPRNGSGSFEIYRELRFAASPEAVWADRPGQTGLAQKAFVKVDTDADRGPDTLLPGTSNFAAGWGASDGTSKTANLMLGPLPISHLSLPHCHVTIAPNSALRPIEIHQTLQQLAKPIKDPP